LKAAIAAENFTGVLVVAITAPDRLTVALLVVLMVGEALAVVVDPTATVATDEGVGATELAVYAFNLRVITVITTPKGQSTNGTRKTHAENGVFELIMELYHTTLKKNVRKGVNLPM
jgi:hypothetical protein